MDIENDDVRSQPDETAKVTTADRQELDWFLQRIVDAVNSVEAGTENEHTIPVTLCVGGILVSGNLISGRVYFSGIADEIRTANVVGERNDDAIEALARSLQELGNDVYTTAEAVQGGTPPHFIHLRSAKVWLPGTVPAPTNRGLLWRGRLEAVDGFWLGTVAVTN